MAGIFSPEPMPVDVISALPAAEPEVGVLAAAELGVDAVDDIAELMRALAP